MDLGRKETIRNESTSNLRPSGIHFYFIYKNGEIEKLRDNKYMEFKCPKCKRTFDSTSRTKDKYCPECEMILRPTKDTVFEKWCSW